jgi:hypothetical protein
MLQTNCHWVQALVFGYLLSLKICMSHHTHKGHLKMMGRYIMQQASRSAGRRRCTQCDTCGHRRACPTMLLCHC